MPHPVLQDADGVLGIDAAFGVENVGIGAVATVVGAAMHGFDEADVLYATGALLDRLTHHVSILKMNGDSYPRSGELVIVRVDGGGDVTVIGTIRTN